VQQVDIGAAHEAILLDAECRHQAVRFGDTVLDRLALVEDDLQLHEPAQAFHLVEVDARAPHHPDQAALAHDSRDAAGGGQDAAKPVGLRRQRERIVGELGSGLIGPLEGVVEYAEALGRETFLGVRRDGGPRLVVCVEGRSGAQPGDRVTYGLVRDGLRYFDPQTGDAVEIRR